MRGGGYRLRAVLPARRWRHPLDTERLGKVAARRGATTAQIAIAALLATSPSVLAIPGTGTLAHLEENVAAGDIDLGDEDLSELRG